VTDDAAPGLLVARITIERRILPDGEDQMSFDFDDGNGETPRLIDIIGLLGVANDVALRGCDCDEEDDE
jgi:hypothetical protein